MTTAFTIATLENIYNTVTITTTTNSTSTQTGALIVSGGVGIGSNLVANQMLVSNAVNANFFGIYSSQVTPSGANYVLSGGGVGGACLLYTSPSPRD